MTLEVPTPGHVSEVVTAITGEITMSMSFQVLERMACRRTQIGPL